MQGHRVLAWNRLERRSRGTAAAVAAVLLLGACGPRGSEVTVDLVGVLPVSETVREIARIDLGTLEARSHLGAGWSVDERRSDGTTMVWAVGGRSELEFYLTRPREVVLELRCSPYLWTGAPPQQVEVWVNGTRAGGAVIPPGLQYHRVPVAAGLTVAGDNQVELKFARSGRPSDHGRTGDSRDLTARFDAVGLVGVAAAAAPSADPSGAALAIPMGAEAGFYLQPASRGWLVHDGVTVPGGGRLDVLWRIDGAPERRLVTIAKDSGPARIELPADGEGRPIRLALRAVGDRGAVVAASPRVSWVAANDRESESLPGRGDPAAYARQPNVLIYLVDTLRTDRLGCYGSPAGLTPHVDALAADGVLFERVAAQSSWTKPSVASVLTGLRPGRHGVNHRRSVLAQEAVTLAELLGAAGYQTAGFSTNAYITVDGGYAQGFDHFQFRPARSHEVTADVVAWLDERESVRPFFLYVHTVDPHAPYEPAAEFRRRFAARVTDPAVGTVEHIRGLGDTTVAVTPGLVDDMLQLYDAEVAENDDAFGMLAAELRRRGLWDETLVVFLSDHGEEFREHGVFGHGWDLYGEVLDVPLIVRAPGGQRGRRVDAVVQHVDLLPTVLDAAGAQTPEHAEGTSLWPVVRHGAPPPKQRPAYSFLDYEGRRGIAARDGRWKLIEPLSRNFAPGRELYDREDDPGELHDLAAELTVRAGLLASGAAGEMARHGTGLPEGDGPEFSGVTREALEALGYIR